MVDVIAKSFPSASVLVKVSVAIGLDDNSVKYLVDTDVDVVSIVAVGIYGKEGPTEEVVPDKGSIYTGWTVIGTAEISAMLEAYTVDVTSKTVPFWVVFWVVVCVDLSQSVFVYV